MEWRSVRFDWNRARAFLVTAEEGSFSAAARALGMAQPTVGRQVSALEEELGVVLFERVGNSLELTAAGLGLVDHVRAMGEAATRVSLAATGQASTIDGSVCITSSELIAAHMLPPIVAGIREAHPGIEVEIVADNQARDLRRREADIAVRNFPPNQPELVARNLGERLAYVYGARTLLERIGPLRTPEDLADAPFLVWDRSDAMMGLLQRLGIPIERLQISVVTENHIVQWEMARCGVGLCIVMEEVGEADPTMARALPDLPPIPVPMWLTSHRELRTSPRIRVVFDHLADALAVSR